MKKYTWLVLLLCFALLAGCGIFDDTLPDNTPGSSSQPTATPKPSESEPPSGVTVEPPGLADRKPVESREPAVFIEPTPEASQPPQQTEIPEASVETTAPENVHDPAQRAIDAIRADAAGSVLAVGYLGYMDGGGYGEVMDYLKTEGYFVRYPFLEEIGKDSFCENGGGEIYVVLPVDADAAIKVSTYDLTDSGNGGSELYSGKGQPVLLRGNISDIMPNLLVTVIQNGESMEYAPYLSLENGRLGIESGVYDCSPYELIIYPGVTAGEFCGEWFARKADSTGEVRSLKLILEEDGGAHFNYGVPYGEVLEVFGGSWWEEDGTLTVKLYGGPISDAGNYEYEYCRDIEVKFSWEKQGIALICPHVGGDALMPGTYGEWFTFRPFDSFGLSGTWSAVGNDKTEYTMQLKENGGCIYTLTDGSGVLQAEYQGSWHYKNGLMSISANMCAGSQYAAGQRGQLSGTYKEEYSNQSELKLSYASGSALSVNMQNNGSETFKKQ